MVPLPTIWPEALMLLAYIKTQPLPAGIKLFRSCRPPLAVHLAGIVDTESLGVGSTERGQSLHRIRVRPEGGIKRVVGGSLQPTGDLAGSVNGASCGVEIVRT